MSKFVSISDTLKSFLESFTASFIVRTHVETTPRGRATHPLLRSSCFSNGSDLLGGEAKELRPLDVCVLGRFFHFHNYACFRHGAEALLRVLLSTYSKNGISLQPVRRALVEELRKEEKNDAYYSLLLCVMETMSEEDELDEADHAFLLQQITSVMNNDRAGAGPPSRVEVPAVLLNRLLLSYLTLTREVTATDPTITRLLLLVFERTTPDAELLTRLITLIPDLFIQQLRCIMQDAAVAPAAGQGASMLYKCVRSLLYLLRANIAVMAPYADTLLDMLVQAKFRVLGANLSQLQFLQTVNLKAVMNKTIRFSGAGAADSRVEDVRGNPRDALYYCILSCILFLSTLPSVFIDAHYAFSISKEGLLRVYSLSLAVLLCTTAIHNGNSNQMVVYTDVDRAPPNRMNRKQNYFLLSFCRQERVLSFFLFNDRTIPYKSILRQIKNGRFAYRDYSASALTKVALLFVPCNSSIQSDACSLCRKQRYNHSMSDLFIFRKKDRLERAAPFLPDNSIEDLDFSSISLQPHAVNASGMSGGVSALSSGLSGGVSALSSGLSGDISTGLATGLSGGLSGDISTGLATGLSGGLSGDISTGLATGMANTPTAASTNKETQLLLAAQRTCIVCGTTLLRKARRHRCCSPMDHFIITPQSLMPQSFSQDCSMNLHLPPASWAICDDCQHAILCGNQSLSPSELNTLGMDSAAWGYKQGNYAMIKGKGEGSGSHGVSLSILLAHVGHGVDNFSLNSDFKIMIRPWGGAEGKSPEAFRIYLQLTDMVIVWYDVLVKGISV